jgi:hypothetical protein
MNWRYLIYALDKKQFRTTTAWIKDAKQLFEDESMLHFKTRQEADKFINSIGFINCASFAINSKHELFNYCK